MLDFQAQGIQIGSTLAGWNVMYFHANMLPKSFGHPCMLCLGRRGRAGSGKLGSLCQGSDFMRGSGIGGESIFSGKYVDEKSAGNSSSVFVRSLKGVSLSLRVNPQCSVLQLESLIQQEDGTPSGLQGLIYARRQLSDHWKL